MGQHSMLWRDLPVMDTFTAVALLGTADLRLLPAGAVLAALSLYASHRFWLIAVRRYTSADA